MEEIFLKSKKLTKRTISDMKYRYKNKISIEDYLYLTSFCKNCEINEPSIIEIHHIDEDRTNNESYNLVGLCPNCHKLVHQEVIKIFNKDGITFISNKEEDKIFRKITTPLLQMELKNER